MFPMQQYSIRARTPEARIDGMGFFPCGGEDVPLPVGARREVAGRVGCSVSGEVVMALEVVDIVESI